MSTLSGSMFEAAESAHWHSIHHKQGAHYNIYAEKFENGIEGLRQIFPTGEADDLNFCLFSTSGVHGSYSTIEEAEAEIERGNKTEDGEDTTPEVTFLIVHPRLVCLRYGNCQPQNGLDIAFLKKLRKSSWEAVKTIGKP